MKRLAHLNHIFVHELRNKRRVFAMVTNVEEIIGQRDEVLDLPMMRMGTTTSIIGLTAIQGQKVYILPVEVRESGMKLGDSNAKDLILVDWALQYL
jgi:hypothetical protein